MFRYGNVPFLLGSSLAPLGYEVQLCVAEISKLLTSRKLAHIAVFPLPVSICIQSAQVLSPNKQKQHHNDDVPFQATLEHLSLVRAHP
jgi:hypothetical protein